MELVEAYPSAVFLRVVAPEEDGGMNVLGYQVEYGDSIKDFSLSKTVANISLMFEEYCSLSMSLVVMNY